MNTFCCGCSLRSGVRYFIPLFITLLGTVQLILEIEEEIIIEAIIVFLLQLGSAVLSFVSTMEITEEATRSKMSLGVMVLMLVSLVITLIGELVWLFEDMDGTALEGISEVITIFIIQGVWVYFAFVEFSYSKAVLNGSITSASGRVYVTNVEVRK